MGFGDLKSPAGLKVLNAFLSDKSYIEGLVLTFTTFLLAFSASVPAMACDVVKNEAGTA